MNENCRILVIDDDYQIIYALKTLFHYQGWEVSTATNVQDGVLRFQEDHPDLIIIDYYMPNINGVLGVELFRRLSSTIPIIVFTIDEKQETADKFLQAGASDFAVKPIKGPDIIARVKLHLQLLRQQEFTKTSFVTKGIGQKTMSFILQYLKDQGEPVSAQEVARGTGLAYPTAYRYLQHLLYTELAESIQVYGKVGKPTKKYRLKKQ